MSLDDLISCYKTDFSVARRPCTSRGLRMVLLVTLALMMKVL